MNAILQKLLSVSRWEERTGVYPRGMGPDMTGGPAPVTFPACSEGLDSEEGPVFEETRFAILGAGTMGQAIARGLMDRLGVSPSRIAATVKHAGKASSIAASLGVDVGTDSAAIVRNSNLVLICTKPKDVLPLLQHLNERGALAHTPLLLSIAAGVKLGGMEEILGARIRVVRAMPNTPCLVGEGMTVLSLGSAATSDDEAMATAIFGVLGRVISLDEEHLDAVTGLSGSGPAFVYVMIEALSEGGVMTGLPRAIATQLAAQTVLGAAHMVLQTGRHPASLKDDVTTPAGCTIAGLLALEDGRIRSVLARGVQEAARAATGLGGTRRS